MLLHDSDKKKHMVFGSDRMHIIAMLLSKLLRFLFNAAATQCSAKN